MTTWCRPDRASSALNRRGSSTTSAPSTPGVVPITSNGAANKTNNKRNHHQHHRHHHVRYLTGSSDQVAPLSSRHSIADILGWKNPSSAAGPVIDGSICKIEQGDNNNQFQQLVLDHRRYDDTEGEEEDDEEEEGMASDCVDVTDMTVNINDEPLDLSLDKSKCRQREREREISGATPIKRAKGMMAVDAMEPASDGGTDEGDIDAVGQWGNVQPHLQMAANFSTVLQYYLTAARLWQTSEVIRCQESQARAGGETDSEANDDGHGSDTNAAAAAVVAAAVAAAGNESAGVMLPVQQQQSNNNNNSSNNNSKRRKNKDGQLQNHMVMVSDLVNSGGGGGADSGNGQSRPRKTRTTFTGKQLFELERIFEQKKYLSSNERQEVARLLNVTGSQIKIWFQNRRTKWKKQDPNTAAELAQLKSASRSSQGGGGTSSSSSAAVPKGKNGEDHQQSGSTNANDDIASAGDNEEINSDDASSPPAPRSPSPV
uniref:Homeobox domain-containing protein n=1 Tax=Daphnia galeata TaxID=27404 RepID=A0A8J2WFD1_9CRUS|nr:unnamed protein product [Daphnia galeata]